tara:strand:+ start:599 stop:1192 length:594 start_codon:yes stop_codon:yes gene_type:complete
LQLQSLFITPIFITEVKGHGHLIDRLYEIKLKDEKGMPRSNIGGWHSDDELYKEEEFKSTVADILYNAKECFKHLDVQDKYSPEMTGLWGMINPPGSRNNIHTHPYNYLSGVYYLKVPPKSGNLVFLEPKPQAEVLSPPKNENASIHLAHSVSWEPKENTLIFFPSWLQHEVQFNSSKEDRIILSFNINWREEDANS